MTATRVLFLDIDGVLNHEGTFRDRRGPWRLDLGACERLRLVIEATGAAIVLSSAWRGIEDGEAALAGAGVLATWHPTDPRTPRGGALRGNEIAEWLKRHPEVTEYAIVDDDDDMLPEQFPRFVRTDFSDGGLRQEHADRLIAVLRPEERGRL